LLGEGLDDDEAAGEGGHEVGVAGVDIERGSRGGRRCGGVGWNGKWDRLAGS
jgi:hypothetical protein